MATIRVIPEYGDEQDACKLNMLVLKRHMNQAGLDVLYMKRHKNGNVIIKVSDMPGQELLNTDKINGVQVEVVLPLELNKITGRIFHPELQYMTAEETSELLRETVPDFCELGKRKREAFADIVWTINRRRELPDFILLGWDRVKVRPLEPRPVRCYHCQAYGHIAADCSQEPVCPTCSGDHEPDYDCQQEPKCPACQGNHTAFDPACPVWLEEKAVMKIRRNNKLSYRDALKKRQEEKKEEQEEKKNQERKRPQEKEEQEEEKNQGPQEEEEEEREELREEEEEEEAKPAETTKRKKNQDEENQDKSGFGRHSGDWQQATSRKKKK